jgi:hypothetical protein
MKDARRGRVTDPAGTGTVPTNTQQRQEPTTPGLQSRIYRRMGELHERATYIASHTRQNQIGLPAKEWAAKLIIALWDHLHWIWTFMNGVLHEDNQGRIARYKVEALQRKIEVVWYRYNMLQGRMDTTLQGHFQHREIINNLCHDSKACWTTLATLYLDETEKKQHSATPEWRHSSCNDLELANEPTTQLFEQGIVATFLFVQVRTNWIRESAIKINDVYYY